MNRFFSVRSRAVLVVLALLWFPASAFPDGIPSDPADGFPAEPAGVAQVAELLDRLDSPLLRQRNLAEAELIALPESVAAFLPEEYTLDEDSEYSTEVVYRLKNVYRKRLRQSIREALDAFTFRLDDLQIASEDRFWITLDATWDARVMPVSLEFPMRTFTMTDSAGREFSSTTRSATLEIAPPGNKTDGSVPMAWEGEHGFYVAATTGNGETSGKEEKPTDVVLTLRGDCQLLIALRPKDFVFERPLATGDSAPERELVVGAQAQRWAWRRKKQGRASVGIDSIRLAALEKGAQTQRLTVHLALDYDRSYGALQSHRTWVYDCRVRLVTAKGTHIPPTDYLPVRQDPRGVTNAFIFDLPAGEIVEALVYTVPTIIVRETTPVTLRYPGR